MIRMISRIALAAGALACAAAAPVQGAPARRSVAAPACDRECWKGHIDAYLDAIVSRDPNRVPLAASNKATVNGRPMTFQEEFWKTTDGFPYRQYLVDPETRQVAVFAVATEGNQRGTFFTRLKVVGGKFAEIETIVGDRRPDGVPGLISPNPLWDYVIPPQQRRSRAELIRIADSYAQGLENHDGSKIPATLDCRRFEDGVQTSLNPYNRTPLPCNQGFQAIRYMDKILNRRYLMADVSRGLVLVNGVISVSHTLPPGPPKEVNYVSGMIMPPNPWSTQPHDTLSQGLFKVIDGKITEFQAFRRDMPHGWGSGW